MLTTVYSLADKFTAISATLTERGLRLWAAAEARSLGYGGITRVVEATGLSRRTVARGIAELSDPNRTPLPGHASRRKGGGRKRLVEKPPSLAADLERLVDP